MPEFLEKQLRAEARKKGFKGKRADRYVYGAMNNMGAMRGSKETVKGAAMQAKHNRDQASRSRKFGNQHIQVETHAYDFRKNFPKKKKR